MVGQVEAIACREQDGDMARFLKRNSVMRLMLGVDTIGQAFYPLVQHGLPKIETKHMLRRVLMRGQLMGDYKLASLRLLLTGDDLFRVYGMTDEDAEEALRLGTRVLPDLRKMPIQQPIRRIDRDLLLRQMMQELSRPFNSFAVARLRFITWATADRIDDFVSEMNTAAVRRFWRIWPYKSTAHIINDCRLAGYHAGHGIRKNYKRLKRAREVRDSKGVNHSLIAPIEDAADIADNRPNPEQSASPEKMLQLIKACEFIPPDALGAVNLLLWREDPLFLAFLGFRYESTEDAFNSLGIEKFDAAIARFYDKVPSWVALQRQTLRLIVEPLGHLPAPAGTTGDGRSSS